MGSIAKLTAVAAAALLLASAVAAAGPADASGYLIVVHPSNRADRLDRKFLRGAFFKKIDRWPDGRVIRPVDLDERAPVRRRFSDQILNRSVPAVKSYWQQLIFSGRGVPPPEMDGDAAIVDYVARNPEAIGYVGSGVSLAGVKVVQVD